MGGEFGPLEVGLRWYGGKSVDVLAASRVLLLVGLRARLGAGGVAIVLGESGVGDRLYEYVRGKSSERGEATASVSSDASERFILGVGNLGDLAAGDSGVSAASSLSALIRSRRFLYRADLRRLLTFC